MTPRVFTLDPLTDPRWPDLVARHPAASVFHTRGWLEALQRTYGYQPIVFTTTDAGSLETGLVLCRVRTWLSRRLVSLPFSDHCDPLVSNVSQLQALLAAVRSRIDRGEARGMDVRSSAVARLGLAGTDRYCLHVLDLSVPLQDVFAGFHPSCTRRAIRRAQREALSYEAGRSDRLLSAFYRLLRMSRRRHGVPPQPLAFFRNLIACLGDRLVIHVASRRGQPIASIVTLRSGSIETYKYGGSDARYHALGGMPFLFWCAIQGARARGCTTLDLGRSGLDQPGLLAFKDHLGATRRELTYAAYPSARRWRADGPLGRAARRLLAHLPDGVLDTVSGLVYGRLG